MKVRTQIQLDPRDHERLKSYADRHRLSMSAAVRMLIQQGLNDEGDGGDDKWAAFLEAAGRGHDRTGATDVARRHDEYLYGADR